MSPVMMQFVTLDQFAAHMRTTGRRAFRAHKHAQRMMLDPRTNRRDRRAAAEFAAKMRDVMIACDDAVAKASAGRAEDAAMAQGFAYHTNVVALYSFVQDVTDLPDSALDGIAYASTYPEVREKLHGAALMAARNAQSAHRRMWASSIHVY